MASKDVALFVTCLTDQFYPRVGVAVTKILRRFGCQVQFPAEQTCCGQPFFNNGFHDEARDLARRMIEIFEPYPCVVTPSASCCAMVREQFPTLLAGDPNWAQRANLLRDRTFEFVEFLHKVLKVDLRPYALPVPTTLTYHYTCHQRAIGMTDEPLQLLNQLGNVRFKPMEKADQCCGFGGTFAVKYPAISGSIVEEKIACIDATGAQAVMCNDAGCTMNIAGAAHRRGSAVQVRHFAELLAEAMGIETEQF